MIGWVAYDGGSYSSMKDAMIAPIAVDVDANDAWTFPLTPAELRVLQYLPTHLSYSAIAAALFISRNTVKTHLAAVYRKFLVSSRSDAVDAAYRLGLFSEPIVEVLEA